MICQSLGGDIWVYSTVGQGSKFQFSMNALKISNELSTDANSSHLISTNNQTVRESKLNMTSLVSDINFSESRAQANKESIEGMVKYSQGMNISENKNKVHLNGLTFELNRNTAYPRGRARDLANNEKLIGYIRLLQSNNFLDQQKNSGLIIYADDQFANHNAMKLQFWDLGLQDRLKMFADGDETIKWFENLLTESSHPQQQLPVSLLLLDINMPIVDGLRACQWSFLNSKFAILNFKLTSLINASQISLL